jgi:hypothetical protein
MGEYEMMSSKKICKEALAVFGGKRQIKKCVEELNELSVALLHCDDGKDTVEHVAEEIADVEIMLQQMTLLFGCRTSVEKHRARKLEQLAFKVKCAQGEEMSGERTEEDEQ